MRPVRNTLLVFLFLLSGLRAMAQNCGNGFVPVKILINPDAQPADIFWNVVTASGDTLRKGLSQSDSLCVPDTACIRFSIGDLAGNGICCSAGVGYYEVFYGGKLARRAYKYTTGEMFWMGCKSCTPGPDQRQIRIQINPDRYPSETAWELLSFSGDTLAKGRNFGDTLCINRNSCTRFILRDSYGDGLCCAHGQGSYEVYADDSLLASGGAFQSRVSLPLFCQGGFDCSSALAATPDTFTTFYDDTWYRFNPDTTGMYEISTCGLSNTCQTKIWVYEYCNGLSPSEGNASTLAYSSSGCGQQARLGVFLQKNQACFIRIGDDSNACNPDPVRWALSYSGPIRGCMDPMSCTFNPLATVPDTSLCLYYPDTNCPGLPDLVVNSPLLRTSFKYDSLDNNDNCYIQEGCLKGMGKRHIIRFSTRIENIGEADYYIGKPPATPTSPSTQWIWDPCHGHWHYKGYAEYILYDRNSNPIPAGFKAGFCVMDLNCSLGGGTPKYNCSNQGITAGCGDIYSSSLKCQWVDITSVDTGQYTLVARVNWDNSPDLLGRIESNLYNNWGQVCFRITKNATGRRFVTPLSVCDPYVDCNGDVFGPALRDCRGVCRGTALQGNINADSVRNQQDLAAYDTLVTTGLAGPTPCQDLNADNQVNVIDYHLLARCLSDSASGSCTFGALFNQTQHTVRISIDSINLAGGFVDLAIENPDDELVAFQFRLSGAMPDSARLIGTGDSGVVKIWTGPEGRIAGSLLGTHIPKSTQPRTFLRLYMDTASNDTLCLHTFESAVNRQLQTVSRQTGTCKPVGSVTYIAGTSGAKDIRIMPNPFNGSALLGFRNPGGRSHTLILYDAQGRILRKVEGITGQTCYIDGTGLPSGMIGFQLVGEKIRSGKIWKTR